MADSDFQVGNFLQGLREASGGPSEPWKVDSPDPSLIPPPDSRGNVETPLLGRLRGAWQRFFGGSAEASEVRAALQEARVELEGRLEMLAQSVQQGVDQADDPVHREIEEAFSEQLGAVGQMEGALDEGADEPDVAAALTRVQDATNRMAAVFRRFEDKVEESRSFCCPHCTERCTVGDRRCPHCGAMLPMVHAQLSSTTWSHLSADGAIPLPGRMTTPNFDRIEQALEMWQSGAASDAEFTDQIDYVAGRFLNHRASVRKDRDDALNMRHVPLEEKAPYVSLLDQIEAALEDGLMALSQMRDGLGAGHRQAVEMSFRRFESNHESICQAWFATVALKDQSP